MARWQHRWRSATSLQTRWQHVQRIVRGRAAGTMFHVFVKYMGAGLQSPAFQIGLT